MQSFTKEDCIQKPLPESLTNKVIVLSKDKQLFFCLRDTENALQTVSLQNGEISSHRKENVIGLLKPELLPDKAKLQLSQIRPFGAKDLSEHTPEYSGYSFLPDGRYSAGVWLCSPEEVKDYVQMQKDYQYRVLICDRYDFAVMEIVQGEVVFPREQDFKEPTQQTNSEMIMG